MTEHAPVERVKNKGIWNLANGEVVRKITEREFLQCSELDGIVVEDGVTVRINSNGQPVATLRGGMHDFVSQNEVDRLMREQEYMWQRDHAGVWNTIKDTVKAVFRFFGASGKAPEKKTVDDFVRTLREKNIITAYMSLDREFPLIIGGNDTIAVRTKYLDTNVGVSMYLKITDIDEVIKNYFVGKTSLTIQDLKNELLPYVRISLQNILGDVELTTGSNIIPVECRDRIATALRQLSAVLHGVSVISVLEVTANNQDLQRFRDLERELYLSESELDYIRRTNEFKNRLAMTEAEQKVAEARNDFEVEKTLQELNKDRILNEEELRDFLRLMQTQRAIKESKSEYELQHALLELKRNKMVDADAMLKFEEDLKAGKLQRDLVNETMRVQGLATLALKKQTLEREISASEHQTRMQGLRQDIEADATSRDYVRQTQMQDARHDNNLLSEELRGRRAVDDYNFANAERRQDLNARQQELERRHMQEMQQMSMSQVEALARLEREQDDAEHRREMEAMLALQSHEREMNMQNIQLEMTKSDNLTRMGADQIAASQLSGMDATAQAELARSLGSGREAELLREQMAQQNALHAQYNNQMQGMMSQFLGAMNSRNDAELRQEQRRTEDMKEMKEEYRSQMQHEQQRLDANQQQSLDYTTRVSTSPSAQHAPTQGNVPVAVVIPSLGNQSFTLEQVKSLIAVGAIKPDTVVVVNGTQLLAANLVK